MAKKKSKSKGRRDAPDIANLRLLVPIVPPPSGRILLDVEDGRLHTPPRHLYTPRTTRQVARVRANPPRPKKRSRPGRNALHALHRLSFGNADQVILCVRRRRRKEVLHAKRVAGRSGLRRPKRNFWSSISCRG